MSTHPGNKEIQEKIAIAELRKLRLEAITLKRQNSRKGQFLQYSTLATAVTALLTALATVVGVWIAISKFIDEGNKDRELRTRELEERSDNQFRSDLKQLLLYPVDTQVTAATVIFLFQDIESLTEGQENRRIRVSQLVSSLTRSAEFDFEHARNIEFDVTALTYWNNYPVYLKQEPSLNLKILDKYKEALKHLHDDNWRFFESISVDSEGYPFFKPVVENFKYQREHAAEYDRFVYLFQGYRKHVETLLEKSQEVLRNGSYLNQAFCSFYAATKNSALTKVIFKMDDTTLDVVWERCP